MSNQLRPSIAGHTALLVSIHHSTAQRDHREAQSADNDAIIAELSRRYSEQPDPQAETYDFIELCLATGVRIVETMELNLKRINPKLYIGSGQFEQVAEHARNLGVSLVAISVPLSPVHQRNWEAELKLPVLSRHDVIFSIFQQNARTAEGKLQVELASLKYELPRIVRSYEQLDPLAGGIGTIGPGEQLTERIKRRHRKRIHEIEQRLDSLRGQRALRRRQRERTGAFTASLVGFTNVGKSTLLNRLTGSGVLVADQYFATLDPTARALRLPSGQRMLLTDTVGFIDDLPQELVSSFRATLEEMEDSQLLVHLADASHPRVEHQIRAVRKIVAEIGMGEKPELLVFNKCDRVDGAELLELAEEHPGAVFLSAYTGDGVAELLSVLEQQYTELAPEWARRDPEPWQAGMDEQEAEAEAEEPAVQLG